MILHFIYAGTKLVFDKSYKIYKWRNEFAFNMAQKVLKFFSVFVTQITFFIHHKISQKWKKLPSVVKRIYIYRWTISFPHSSIYTKIKKLHLPGGTSCNF